MSVLQKAFSTLISPYTDFSLKLFNAIASDHPGKNIITSPVSAAILLAMACNGAQGSTRAAIEHTLQLDGMALDDLNKANAALLTELQQLDPQIKLSIENSLHTGGDTLQPAFLQICQQAFQAKLVQDVPPGTVTLKNVIDFAGKWTAPFAPSMTQDDRFTAADGGQKRCRMMQSAKRKWRYYEDDRFQMVCLPYGNERASFYVVLPAENVPLAKLLAELTPENWQRWQSRLTKTEGTIELPRFEMRHDMSLKSLLANMGMAEAFDPARANFSGLSSQGAYIDQVEQRANIRVHEEGTEAHAETEIKFVLLGMGIERSRSFHLKANRPFLYVIQDERTHLPLFMGILADPAPQEAIVHEESLRLSMLAESLELMVSVMDSGQSFDAAMGKVYEVYDHELALGFGRVIREIQLGKPRSGALKWLRDRNLLPQLNAYLDAVIQAQDAQILPITRDHLRQIRAKRSGN